ncbi:MAG: CDP-diacylglycerol--serine O-phosphatidyltransferase [Gammaproteobacteria bacterium]|nr:MAG: CDP-diacylglycerol--serine O-phosphatidyltransferase [Gammaproteobacteria bacterium]
MTEDSKQRRGIYLLPNLFTTGAMFGGFYAIIAAMHDKYEAAAIAVFVAMILDGLDGRIARMTNATSAFGAEYDSLSDMVSFGLAPALVMYEWALVGMKDFGWQWGKLGWLAAFFYAVCAALRLARFNTQVGKADKRYFQGLPSPTAAALLMGMVWSMHDLGIEGRALIPAAFALTLIAGALMVSNISYYSFKELDLKHKVPFWVLIAAVLVLMLVTFDTPKVLFMLALVYTASGPVIAVMRRFRRRRRAGGKV